MFKGLFIITLLFWAQLASAYIVVRQHSSTISQDLPILASDLNDEFNNLISGVNSIDSTNIVNGSLTQTNFAATSTAISLNKREGCGFSATGDVTGIKTVNVTPPCEIYMDGVRGFITATQSVSLLNNLLDGGTLAAANYYFLYASMNNSSLSFSFSQTVPVNSTTRKTGNSAFRYLGTVRTQDATKDIVLFNKIGNQFFWTQPTSVPGGNAALSGLISTPTTTAADITFTVPKHWDNLLLQYSAYVDAFPAQCQFITNAARGPYQAIVIATGGHTGIIPTWLPVRASVLPAVSYKNISNCVIGGDLRIVGWTEPFSLFE